MKATVFLGAGRITQALVQGLRLSGDQRTIALYDRHPEKLRAFEPELGVEIAHELKSAVERADMLIIAVRPTSVAGMLEEVVACGRVAPRVSVSLAAGVPLSALRARLGPPTRWVRAMPSPVCRVGRGLTALCSERGLGSAELDRVRRLFQSVGQVVEVPEPQFDAFTATYSSSHGYHALATLADAAQEAGLDHKTALMAAAHALSDGIMYWRESGQSVSALLQEAATPGGIAAATMAAMDKAGYARVVRKGLRSGIAQARRNAKFRSGSVPSG